MRKKKKVIIRRSLDYNPEDIKKIIQEGLSEFGLSSKAKGKITIKPNVVMAHHKIAPSASMILKSKEIYPSKKSGKKQKIGISVW